MPSSSSVNVKAAGYHNSQNSLELPPGALSEATNIIIKRDDVIEPRRGFKVYGDSFGTSTDTASALFGYKQRILRHFASTLQFQNGFNNDGSVHFDTFSGSFSDAQEGLRIKHVESNGNLYFTTSEGIKKISAKNSTDLSSSSNFITQAGGIKALDLTTSLVVTLGGQSGFLPEDSAVAYRVVWGTKDANDNLILGEPSQRSEIYNPLITLELQDFLNLLGKLDDVSNAGGSLISDGNYTDTLKLPISASATELRTNLISLVSKIDTDILYADNIAVAPLQIVSAVIASGVCTITFAAGPAIATDYFQPGSNILLSGFTPVVGTINGAQVVISSTATTITFSTTATGVVTLATPKIYSNEFRNITQPIDPAQPATHDDLIAIQTYISEIFSQLQISPSIGTSPVISSTSQTDFIANLDITTSANVLINITIPIDVTSNYFYQIYRSSIASATGPTVLSTDVFPDDELRLVYEAFPTGAELSAKTISVVDITPDEFRGANLYTNAATGEGILQANGIPPFALDINRFKNYVFFANTRTRYSLSSSLLGVVKLINDYNNSITPTLSVVSGSNVSVYKFVTGQNEETDIVCVADVANNLNGKYFTINSANDETGYYVWYKTSGGSTSDPTVSGKIGIRIDVPTGSSATIVAANTRDGVAVYVKDFTTNTFTPGTTTIQNNNDGYTTDATSGTSGFTINIITQGRGENASLNEVLLSTAVSVGTAVDETARSLVRIINKNSTSTINAYYLSGAQDVPGKMLFESKSLQSPTFYLVANNLNTGSSFNPDISPELSITAISTGAISTITTPSPHNLVNKDQIVITNSNSTPLVDGIYTINYISPTTFSITPALPVTVAGTSGVFIKASDSVFATNAAKKNRVYWSKFQQPEAVPALNYLDVGDADKEIVRIFPLRDSLFVFKEEGLYRISGETSPFNLALFDSSCQIIAPDTVDVANNLIYGFSTQGISTISESGVNIISRKIDVDILKIPTYSGYKTASWGIGYESDNSYTLWTITKSGEDIATIGYRYSTLTDSYTIFDKSFTCGFINLVDDRMYAGAGDINNIEQERKNFDRYDYSDREYTIQLIQDYYFGTTIKLLSVDNISEGDVIVQEQTVNIYTFNQLLKKLDLDPSVGDSNYFSTLQASAGNGMRNKLVALATKLDADPGVIDTNYLSTINTYSGSIVSNTSEDPTVITTASAHNLFTGRYITIASSNSTPNINGVYEVTVLSPTTFSIDQNVTNPGTTGSWSTADTNFNDQLACYNEIIIKLNLDTGVSFDNYSQINITTVIEAIVLTVNKAAKQITVNFPLDFVLGPMTVFKGIEASFTYAPITFSDPMSFKQIREATLMFNNKAFSNATLGFSTDLLPAFVVVPFSGDGNGIFGYANGFGTGFFGGSSNGAPFRTYVPVNAQRCRYLKINFTHFVARETFSIFGLTLTGRLGISARAYR